MMFGKLCTNRLWVSEAEPRMFALLVGACVLFAGAVVEAGERPLAETPVALPAIDGAGMADEMIYVNFDQVDIRVMLKTVGELTGINFVVDDSVTGTVTVMSPTKIRVDEIYDVLESVLDVKGYAAVPSGKGGLVKIVPKADDVKQNLPVRIGADPAEIPLNDSLVTQIMPLNYADVREVEQII